MTIGIYKLVFNNTSKVYIGQSINIEKRFIDHNSNYKNSRMSAKLAQAYTSFGYPKLEILKKCTNEELDRCENKYIKEFDSFNNGFNSLELAEDIPKPITFGDLNKSSKYTNKQIEEVFHLLLDIYNKFSDISEKTGIDISTIRSISQGINHKWLKEKYPKEYLELEILKGNRISANKNKVFPKIKDPEGNIYEVINLSKFAREHNLSRNRLSDFLHNKKDKYKNWTFA